MTPQDLVTIREIEQLKYRYVRLLDLKEWDELETLFAADATASYGGGAYSFEGRNEIMGFLRRSMDRTAMVTSHKVHQPEITILDADTATGRWGLDDKVIDSDFGITINGAAFYEDRYERHDGTWLIAHTGYKRVYEELQPRPADLTLTAHYWDSDGKSSLPAG